MLNGVTLDATDYTASNGNSVILGSGISVNDELVVIAFNAFSIADAVSAASGGTFVGAVNMTTYTKFGSLTTTQRNALTGANGMIIYNTTDNKFQGYENGAWANLI
jgi:hypothetical protein